MQKFETVIVPLELSSWAAQWSLQALKSWVVSA
jgi:hypothetical protein